MSHGSRRNKSARPRVSSATLPNQTLNLSIDDNLRDDPLPPPPPRKERKHRHQNKDTAESTLTTGGTAVAHDATGQGNADEEEEETEEEDIPLAGRPRIKRNRPSSLHGSPDVRKRARARVSTSSTLARTVEAETDSGDERDVSDLDLDDADSEDDEDDLLDIETRHLIDDFEDGNQSSEGESDNEDVLLSITKIPIDQLDGDAWIGFEPRRSHRAELEGLLALADEPLEGGVISSIWYQDAGVGGDLDNIGDSESAGSGGSASEPDTDEEADQLLLMRSWASDSNEGSMSEDEGDTTDSLDDGDELALIRFGIEVDEDVEHDPAPSVRSSETMVDMAAFAANPDAVIDQTATKLGVDRATAARILTGVGLSVIAQHDGDKAGKASSPKMGEFTATKPPETTIMVEGGAAPVPSPFSARRSARLRQESSPSRRRNSVASHSSSLSLPSSGPKSSPSLSPAVEMNEEPERPAMDLDEVLHAAVLDPEGDAASSESEVVEDGTDQESALGIEGGQFADLHRWDRIPIGAFRRSRAAGSRSPLPDQGNFHFTAALFRGSPVLLPVQRVKGKSKSGLATKKGKKLGISKHTPVKSSAPSKRAPSSLRKVAAQAAFLSSSPRPSRSKTGTPSFGGSPLFSTTGASTSTAPIPPLHL